MVLKTRANDVLRIDSVYYANLGGVGVVLPANREVRYSYYDSAVKLGALEYRQPSLMESLATLKRNEELRTLLGGNAFYLVDDADALVPGSFSLLDGELVQASAPGEGEVRIVGGQSPPLFSVGPPRSAGNSSEPFVADASGTGQFSGATVLVGISVKQIRRK
jgi:hypothetical protein